MSAVRAGDRFRRLCLLLGFLILSTLVAILGTSIPGSIGPGSAHICAPNHGSRILRPDKAGETEYEGPHLPASQDHFFFLPDPGRDSGVFNSLPIPVAKQLPGQLRANYFRPPPIA